MRAYLFKLRFRSLKRRSLSAPLKKPTGSKTVRGSASNQTHHSGGKDQALPFGKTGGGFIMATSDAEILFVDDDRTILELVGNTCRKSATAWRWWTTGCRPWKRSRTSPMPSSSPISKCGHRRAGAAVAIKEYRPETEVIIVTGHGSMESAIKAMKYGATTIFRNLQAERAQDHHRPHP